MVKTPPMPMMFTLLIALLALGTEAKRLKDWFEAEWFADLVKIPLTIDDSALWYANLAPCQNEDCSETISGGKCIIDNNNPYTILYPNSKTGEHQTWDSYDFDACGDTN